MDERELVGLIYRADWTRLSLTGTVRGTGQFPTTHAGSGHWSASFGGGQRAESFPRTGFLPEPPDWMTSTAESSQAESALSVAPGRRYRLARTDGSRVLGCDGDRVWQWLADVPPDAEVKFERRPQPPVATLLAPAWLLTGGRLTIEGETTVAGRPGIAVTAVASTAPLRGLYATALLTWGLVPRPERVSVVIDAELGIVLRRELWYPERTLPPDRVRQPDDGVSVTEFTAVEVGGAVDTAAFEPVAGSFFGDGKTAGEDAARPAAEQIGLDALKLAGGLAAGGLGAALRLSPKRHPDPFATATGEAPDDLMPDDEPLPGWALGQPASGIEEPDDRPPVSDEVLNLLYRSGGEPVPFSGRLLEWSDGGVIGRILIDAVPESARRAGFGGFGYLLETVLDAAGNSGVIEHTVYSLRVGAWDRYRVDHVFRAPTERARRHRRRQDRRDVLTVACDGERTFRVYEDEVRIWPAGTLDDAVPGELLHLINGSWLLRYRLSGGDLVEVDGRPGYRVIATSGDGPVMGSPMSWLPGFWLPAVAVVDASTGRLLRLTRYQSGEMATRTELRSVADGGSDDFGFTPPDGLPVVDQRDRRRPDRAEDDDDEDGEATFFGPDGRRSSAPDQVKDVLDAVKKQVDDTVAAARGFLGSFLGGPR